MEGYGWIVIIVSVIISLVAAIIFRNIASDKGYEGSAYFWLPFLLGIAGWAIIIALPDRVMNETLNEISKKLDKLNEKPMPITQKEISVKTNNGVANSDPNTESNKDPVVPLSSKDENTIVCPKCGEVQNAGRKLCWRCGATFVVDD